MKICLCTTIAAFFLLSATPHAKCQEKSADAVGEATSDTATTTQWIEAAPFQVVLPSRLTTLLRAQEVISYVAPGVLYPARNIGLQCQGVNATLADVPGRVATANTKLGASEIRFGEVEIDGVRAFRLQADAIDPLPINVSPRCELVAYPMLGSALPQGEIFWFAFSFWADDWAGTRDEQLIAQMHIQEPQNILLNPFFAMVVRGSELRVELRHNDRTVPDKASTQLVTAARLAMPVRQWVSAVVQARISTHAKQKPFLRLWLNGQLVADYSGPFGYVLPPSGHAYQKVGIYHWNANNPWDYKIPSRALLIGAVIATQDTEGRYSHESLRASVAVDKRR
jgi:hypothetical protein